MCLLDSNLCGKHSSLSCSAAWEFCNCNHNLEDAFLAFAGHILLASLAVTDFAVGLIAQPLLISLLLTANYGSSHIFQINCLVFNLVAYFLCGVSFTTVTVIGLERLLTLRLHLRYNSTITTNRVKLAIVGIRFRGGLSSLLWLRNFGDFTVLVVIGFVLLVANLSCLSYLSLSYKLQILTFVSSFDAIKHRFSSISQGHLIAIF